MCGARTAIPADVLRTCFLFAVSNRENKFESLAGLLIALPLARPCCSSPTGHPTNKKSPLLKTADFLVGCPVGLEPTVSRSTIWRVNRLRYRHHIMRPKGLEPPAHCLEGSCSIHLSYGRTLLSHWVPLWRQSCVGTRCEKYNTIRTRFCQGKNRKIFFLFCTATKTALQRSVTAATCRRSPAQSPVLRRRAHPAGSAHR